MPCEFQRTDPGVRGGRRKHRKHSRTQYDLRKPDESKFELTGTSEFTDRTDQIITGMAIKFHLLSIHNCGETDGCFTGYWIFDRISGPFRDYNTIFLFFRMFFNLYNGHHISYGYL